MIHLQTERLLLRNLHPTDAEVMHDYRNNPLCAKYQRGQTTDLPGISALIAAHCDDIISDDKNFIMAVTLENSNRMIGEVVVLPNEGCFSIGYTLHYDHHRKGYAYEALHHLTTQLHETYPHMEFISFVDPENNASRKLLEKLGYSDLGYVPQVTSQMYGKWIKDMPAG